MPSRQLVATRGLDGFTSPSISPVPTPHGLLARDRLLPADLSVRDAARRFYQHLRDLPIISPHGPEPVARRCGPYANAGHSSGALRAGSG
jgi:hypothetical protein